MNPAVTASEHSTDDHSSAHSVFQKLIRVAAQRNLHTGLYTAIDRYDQYEGELKARANHVETFRRWLSLPLPEQYSEISRFLLRLCGEKRRMILALLQADSGRKALLPDRVAEEEYLLFESNLRVLIEAISRQSEE
jgi:hypothetical protein